MGAVRVEETKLVLPTYWPEAPVRHPMFLERRVYQGSSGKVYPLPFHDRVAEKPVPHGWVAVVLENEYLRVTVLPEIGGRIHAIYDKARGVDLIYNQRVIKPALVGLAGPWVSGGIEFNWPQHHRPGTFMAVEWNVERGEDGSATVWLGDHDPIQRMKGMHGVRLSPGVAAVDVRVRLHNRTALRQSFLWWANAAVAVHDRYQSFFPPDVRWVADHARRAMTEFPLSRGRYYGVDYGGRAEGEADLSWYRNIPVPMSYMAVGSAQDFFGGYDHGSGVGVVHVADHRIAPGKKQWTWGNAAFGRAWDRHLTDADGNGGHRPYIELMAGVYTDNQPDFSWLMPGETKAFEQRWWPIHDIGVPVAAGREAALSVRREGKGRNEVSLGVCAAREGVVRVEVEGSRGRMGGSVGPGRPWVGRARVKGRVKVRVVDGEGRELVAYEEAETGVVGEAGVKPLPATEPPMPREVRSVDELWVIGTHLAQYRHATREAADYWREGLRRDAGDARCNTALGDWHLRRGEFALAEGRLRAAVGRLTARNANPADGEAHYLLGVTLRYLGRWAEAGEAFAKAAWDGKWAGPAWLALGEAEARGEKWDAALGHVQRSVTADGENTLARNLAVLVLRRLGRGEEAERVLNGTLAVDPLDAGARALRGEALADAGMARDVALDWRRAGFEREAAGIAGGAEVPGLPHRLEDYLELADAQQRPTRDADVSYRLGNFLYDRRRHREAIAAWERAVRDERAHAGAWRNLGIAYFNVLGDARRARSAYERAVRLEPGDARIVYERDQLWQRTGVPPKRRLAELGRRRGSVGQRDDLTVAYCALLNEAGRPGEAAEIMGRRRFQPWEGGEGVVLEQWVRTQLLLGRRALAAGETDLAVACFEKALEPPESIGEARHPLANASDVQLGLGLALRAAGREGEAVAQLRAAAEARGDFQRMAVREMSEMTYFSGLALQALGRGREAHRLAGRMLRFAARLRKASVGIDYFATSLPALLLFDDDLAARQAAQADVIEAQARMLRGEGSRGRRLLEAVRRRDPNHALAGDLLGLWARKESR